MGPARMFSQGPKTWASERTTISFAFWPFPAIIKWPEKSSRLLGLGPEHLWLNASRLKFRPRPAAASPADPHHAGPPQRAEAGRQEGQGCGGCTAASPGRPVQGRVRRRRRCPVVATVREQRQQPEQRPLPGQAPEPGLEPAQQGPGRPGRLPGLIPVTPQRHGSQRRGQGPRVGARGAAAIATHGTPDPTRGVVAAAVAGGGTSIQYC